MRALIIVDVQKDFCPSGRLAVYEGDMVVPVINKIQPIFDLIVATQDWHPEDHESFAVNHQDANPGDVIDLHGLKQVLWPVHCVQGSEGAEFHESLNLDHINRVIQKGMNRCVDSYSGFFDNGHKAVTGLEGFLRERGVDEVYICGLATDYCVKYTALDSVALGFRTFLIDDACRGVELTAGDVESAVKMMKVEGVAITSSDKLM